MSMCQKAKTKENFKETKTCFLSTIYHTQEAPGMQKLIAVSLSLINANCTTAVKTVKLFT